jgi:hypothetical protein
MGNFQPTIDYVSVKTNGVDFLEMILRLPAGNDSNLNISVVTDAFKNHAEQAFTVDKAIREKIFCRNEEEFF